jgi:hypothetical protein
MLVPFTLCGHDPMSMTFRPDLPAEAPPRRFRAFYWTAFAIGAAALFCVIGVYGVRSGRGLLDAWLYGFLMCLAALAITLPMLLHRPSRRQAGRAAMVSALGLVVTFVGFGFAHDENQARMAARRAPAAAHGVALPGASVIESEATPSADESRR